MSYDVQMFVQCNHIVRVKGLPNPSISPTLSIVSDENSLLEVGTYYISYSWHNNEGETLFSPYSKIFVSPKESIGIVAPLINNNDIFSFNYYVGFYPDDLTGDVPDDMLEERLKLEETIKSNSFLQGGSDDGTYEFSGPIVVGRGRPVGNSTVFRNFSEKDASCPRCYGRGFYFDISFDPAGEVIKADNSTKLLQEMLKVIIEDKAGNVFHPNWGCDVSNRIGTKKRGVADKFKVEMSIRNAIEHLKRVQESNQASKRNMNPEEMIVAISSIVVEEDGPTGYNVYVEVLSGAGEVIAYNVNM